jgi:hypothetical protein
LELGLKNPLAVPRPLSGYDSCTPPSSRAIAEWAVVADPLVMGGKALGVFLIGTSDSETSIKLMSVRAAILPGRVFFICSLGVTTGNVLG